MAEGSAKRDVQVSVGKDFVIIGTDRVEVSPDGKKVTAYTNDGVETKAASRVAPVQGISISADFKTVVLNGATIERAADGHLVVSAPGGVVITKPAPANDTAAEATVKIGHEMEDGTILAGYYEGRPLYATPVDAALTCTFNQAQTYAAELNAHGHRDWRVPTKGELNVLYNNHAAIGGFNISGSDTEGWYWSSTQDINYGAWAQRFSDGGQKNYYKLHDSSLRCVR